MFGRPLPVVLFLTCAAAAFWPDDVGAAESPNKRPNVLVFLCDDLGRLDCEPYGAKDVRTPNLAKLAAAGMTFDQAFVASPSCAPSRAAMLTGLMPARNGAEANHTFKRDEVASLPESLRKMGYQTAAFGKIAHGSSRKEVGRHGFDASDAGYDAKTVATFLDQRDAGKPLCLFVGTRDPHVPWPDEPKGYEPANVALPAKSVDTPNTRLSRARYCTDATQADTDFGAIYALAMQRLGPDTLVVFSSDHGAQWPFAKWNLYDAGVRVPLVVAWPGRLQPGVRSDAMVQWIDLIPTLIDACGGEVAAGLDGRSFLPVLLGKSATHRDVIFTTHSNDKQMNVYPTRSVRTLDWKLILNLHPEFAYTTHIDKAYSEREGAYWPTWVKAAESDPAAAETVSRYHKRPELELYDLRNDPTEQRNLADDPAQADRVKSMRQQLERWMSEQGDRRAVFDQPWMLNDPASLQPRSRELSPAGKGGEK